MVVGDVDGLEPRKSVNIVAGENTVSLMVQAINLLLAEELLEVCDSVVGVADEEVLCLAAVVLLAVDVRQYRGYLTVYALGVSLFPFPIVHLLHIPPSSLAITSALSSMVYAMELFELPKVMPMATRSPASLSLMFAVLLDRLVEKEGVGLGGVWRGRLWL